MKLRLFLVFMVGFASAFNTFAIQFGSRPLSAGLLATAMYFLSIVPLLEGNLLKRPVKEYGKFIMLPLWFCLLLTIMNIVYYQGGGVFPFSVFMDWVLMYVLLLHSLSDKRVIDYCLYGFSFGAIVLSVLFYFGIGVEVNTIQEGDRFSMFGSNENVLGIIQAISVAVILNLFILKDRLNLHRVRYVFLAPIVLSVTMIMATGSRTALLILSIVFVISLLFYQTKTYYKVIIIAIGFVVGYFALQWFLTSDSTILARVFTSIDEGNTGGRTYIWERYLAYFPEHPILGVGDAGMMDLAIKSGVGTTEVLGYRTALSPHNVLIEVLMETGLVGLLIMLAFWWKTFKCSFKSLKRYRVSLPLVLIAPVVVVLFTGQLLAEKYAWFIYAYMIASSCGRIIVVNEAKR